MAWRNRSRSGWYGGFRPYVPVATRRQNAAREIAALAKRGVAVSPVRIAGRLIATTFWGRAWCDHLEGHSDYANRLPRGRTYVRNGSVVDLQIAAGKVTALVQGSELYKVAIDIQPVRPERWKAIVGKCAGAVASIVELLRGKLSDGVMGAVTSREAGLFPEPREIAMKCSCPDWATMCKHVAAVLYGVGARLDEQPELLFCLRATDPAELVTRAAAGQVTSASVAADKVLETSDLAGVFGIDLDGGEGAPAASRRRGRKARAAAEAVQAPPVEAAAGRRARATGSNGSGREGARARPSKAVALAARSPDAPRRSEIPTRPRAAKPAGAASETLRTAAEFDRLGVPRDTVAYWVRVGALAPGRKKGSYVETDASWLGRYAAAAVREREARGEKRRRGAAG